MFLAAPDESTWLGVLRLGLLVPGARSLKDKRRAVASVRDRLKARHNVSVAEVGHLEDHTRAVLAVALVGNDPRFVRSVLDALAHEVAGWRSALVESSEITVARPYDSDAPQRYGDADD